jgi:hypothetical protein
MVSAPQLMWAICLCMATTAAGHGMMMSPTPRTGTRNAGNNKGRGKGPCGSGGALQTQGSPVASYEPGQSVNVQWRIDARHGGSCRISLSTSGGGVPSGLQDLTGNFACARSARESKTVIIPQDASCENCVLQWYWNGDSDYFNCMDISIKRAGPPPTPPPPPAPTPAPTRMPPMKTDEPWALWIGEKCLSVHERGGSARNVIQWGVSGQLSTDAELVTPGVMTGEIDAEHDGGPCSAFHAYQFPGGDRTLFRLCECKTKKGGPYMGNCMCSNQALTYIKSTVGGGVDASGAWEVRIEDAAHLNEDQLFDEKPSGANCVASDPSKCVTVSAWKAPKKVPPTRRRTAPKPGEPPTAPPCKDARRRRRSDKKPTRRRSATRKATRRRSAPK